MTRPTYVPRLRVARVERSLLGLVRPRSPRRKHATTYGVRLRRARDGDGHLGHDGIAAGNGGFKTAQPSMLTAIKSGVTVTPLLTVGDVFGERLPVRGHPGRHLAASLGQGRVDLYVNHETSKVPFPFNTAQPDGGQRGERLRQLPGEPADPEPAGRRARRLVRHPEQRRLPAVLLQLPRDEQGGIRPGHPVHERGVAGLRVPAGGLVAASDRRPGRGGERRRPRARSGHGHYHTIYGMGRHNHENDVAIPGFDDLVVLSGDDTFTSGPLTIPPAARTPRRPRRPSRSCTPTSPRTRTRCSPTKATSGRSSRTTPASTTTTTSPPAPPSRSPVTSSRCRRTSPPGRTPTAPR